jgi:uncharacterized protein (DUF488 family)
LTPEHERLINTLGTSTRSWDEFVRILKGHIIEEVVDVRRFPTSRFEYFSEEKLAELLDEAEIDYIAMGQELGGFRKGNYQAFTATPEFQEGVGRLEELAQSKRVTIICAERLPWRCHRRFIGFELERRGWQVIHIIDEKRDWQPGKARETE